MQSEQETETPPIYTWDRVDVLAFAVMSLSLILFVEVGLLWLSGFSDIILLAAGAACAVYFWPKLGVAVEDWWELRKFKKSIPDGMKVKDEDEHED